MESITEINLIKELRKKFPNFVEENPIEEFCGNYDYIGHFSFVLEEELDKTGEKNHSFIEKAFEFFNKMAEEGNDEVQNILIVEVLESLADEGTRTKVAREKLKGKALEYFERVLRGWDKD